VTTALAFAQQHSSSTVSAQQRRHKPNCQPKGGGVVAQMDLSADTPVWVVA
jgi:hypothetical protein